MPEKVTATVFKEPGKNNILAVDGTSRVTLYLLSFLEGKRGRESNKEREMRTPLTSTDRTPRILLTWLSSSLSVSWEDRNNNKSGWCVCDILLLHKRHVFRVDLLECIVVQSWILRSLQPHRVTSGHINVWNFLIYIYQIVRIWYRGCWSYGPSSGESRAIKSSLWG